MRKLAEVEEARLLFTGAVNWSVMRWLKEKKKVRKAADQANAALWAMQKTIKESWGDDLRLAYEIVAAPDGGDGRVRRQAIAPEVKLLAKRVKEADDEAYQAHLDAEETFDQAEKRLSTSMAREGSKKAVLSWELYEKAIIIAEAGLPSSKPSK